LSGLLRVKSGSFELFLAETATALSHPSKVTDLAAREFALDRLAG
jgi:hypothetical protein